MAAPPTYSAEKAYRIAEEGVATVTAERQAQLLGEADTALLVARAYAEHLADGGFPWVTPQVSGTYRFRNRDEILSPYVGLIVVYRFWNEIRGVSNPLLPFQDSQAWQVAERFYSRLGTPVLYAEFAGNDEHRRKVSPSAVQDVLKKIAAEDQSVVPRRTKVEGKVAYFLRSRRDGDEEIRDGWYRGEIPEESP